MNASRLFARTAAITLLAVLGVFVLGASGCGGFSTEDAEARCDQEAEARSGGGCFSDTTYDACVTAYEECGEDVQINDACPLSYSCPE